MGRYRLMSVPRRGIGCRIGAEVMAGSTPLLAQLLPHGRGCRAVRACEPPGEATRRVGSNVVERVVQGLFYRRLVGATGCIRVAHVKELPQQPERRVVVD